MTNVTQLHNLTASDFDNGKRPTVVRLDCEAFEVESIGQGRYIVKNRTHFMGGQKVARSLDEVRDIIRSA